MGVIEGIIIGLAFPILFPKKFEIIREKVITKLRECINGSSKIN